jgi:hypothetical protein
MKPMKKIRAYSSGDSQIREWLREIRIEKIEQSQERKDKNYNKVTRYFK